MFIHDACKARFESEINFPTNISNMLVQRADIMILSEEIIAPKNTSYFGVNLIADSWTAARLSKSIVR